MTQGTYRKTLTTARRDLEKLYRQREELERKIAKLRQTIISLGALTKESKKREQQKSLMRNDVRLTDAVTRAIMASDVPLHPKEIRRNLEDLGYDIGSSNPAASIWSVLKRLEEQPVYEDRPGKTVLRMYDKPTRAGIGVGAIGYWWGNQKPPAPWVPSKWWEERKRRKAKTKSADKNEK